MKKNKIKNKTKRIHPKRRAAADPRQIFPSFRRFHSPLQRLHCRRTQETHPPTTPHLATPCNTAADPHIFPLQIFETPSPSLAYPLWFSSSPLPKQLLLRPDLWMRELVAESLGLSLFCALPLESVWRQIAFELDFIFTHPLP